MWSNIESIQKSAYLILHFLYDNYVPKLKYKLEEEYKIDNPNFSKTMIETLRQPPIESLHEEHMNEEEEV